MGVRSAADLPAVRSATPPHDYHFQVFALDTRLDLPPGAGRAALLQAMQGHVLAAGEVIGTYARQDRGAVRQKRAD